ncbi:hypothetical protein FNV43_RR07954 [Rhamnella rubrinervis]|uniref:Uncharacterized protein n=1 Tax=Rhamnella rubrinervis TaxID=2594499 RepID=A0A8K0HHM6_9ROSA|nr:hypothetical protein FNV43_RR07954 [Rhamnella rubrinervis]
MGYSVDVSASDVLMVCIRDGSVDLALRPSTEKITSTVFCEGILKGIDYELEEGQQGAALISVVHTLRRFRKRMLYYGVVPRRTPGDAIMEWFKKPIVQLFLLNEMSSRADVLMHKLNTLFPSSAPKIRSLSPPKPLITGRSM